MAMVYVFSKKYKDRNVLKQNIVSVRFFSIGFYKFLEERYSLLSFCSMEGKIIVFYRRPAILVSLKAGIFSFLPAFSALQKRVRR